MWSRFASTHSGLGKTCETWIRPLLHSRRYAICRRSGYHIRQVECLAAARLSKIFQIFECGQPRKHFRYMYDCHLQSMQIYENLQTIWSKALKKPSRTAPSSPKQSLQTLSFLSCQQQTPLILPFLGKKHSDSIRLKTSQPQKTNRTLSIDHKHNRLSVTRLGNIDLFY